MIEVIQVPAAAVAGIWPKVEPMLEPAINMSHGCYWPVDVMAFCAGGTMQLWVAYKGEELVGSAVTELIDAPRRRFANVKFAGGKEVRSWYAAIDAEIEAWARAWGADGLMTVGRKGWERLLKPDETSIELWRDLKSPASPAEVH